MIINGMPVSLDTLCLALPPLTSSIAFFKSSVLKLFTLFAFRFLSVEFYILVLIVMVVDFTFIFSVVNTNIILSIGKFFKA